MIGRARFAVGLKLYGYCGGLFGRDGYSNKCVEALGIDWLVARSLTTNALFFASFNNDSEWETLWNDSEACRMEQE